jgi:hypothetical protein
VHRTGLQYSATHSNLMYSTEIDMKMIRGKIKFIEMLGVIAFSIHINIRFVSLAWCGMAVYAICISSRRYKKCVHSVAPLYESVTFGCYCTGGHSCCSAKHSITTSRNRSGWALPLVRFITLPRNNFSIFILYFPPF